MVGVRGAGTGEGALGELLVIVVNNRKEGSLSQVWTNKYLLKAKTPDSELLLSPQVLQHTWLHSLMGSAPGMGPV